MRFILTALGLWLSIVTPAQAGYPIEETATCPIGGEEFVVYTTTSCSRMGATLSLRPITTCDFVTELPVCPGNGLPMFQEFSEDDLAKIETFMETPAYQALREGSAWQRAYAIAAELEVTGTTDTFCLQLRSFWMEPDAFVSDPRAVAAFHAEWEAEVERAADADTPYLLGIRVALDIQLDKIDRARATLAEMEAAAKDNEFLQEYIEALAACLGTPQAETCHPNTPLPR